MLDVSRSWPGSTALSFGILIWSLAQAPVWAAADDVLKADGWSEVFFDGKMPNHFTSDETGGLIVRSDKSVSLLQKPIDIDLDATPRLTWRWRVSLPAPPTDLGVKGGDDRSLALYVAFPYQPEEAGVMERMKRAIIEKVAGKKAPGRVLIYVWGGLRERGERVKSPYMDDAGVITILRGGNTEPNAWFEETINVKEDYRQIFGKQPPDPISIAIGADTDDTMTLAEGVIADLHFIP